MRKAAIFLVTFGAMAIAAMPVLAALRHEHKFRMTFSSKKPASSSGVSSSTNRVGYQVPAPGQAADPVTRLVFTLQRGARIDTSVVPACSKQKLDAQGPSGCPSRSKVGSGSATVITGLPAFDPIHESVTLFAKRGGLLAYLQGVQNLTIPLKASANRLTADIPRVCLPGGTPADNCKNGEAVLTIFKTTIKAKKTSKGTLVTTPRKCPASRKWTNTATYTFRNGDTETERSSSPCNGK